jgi:DNA-binding MarR family transcriptional regulator
MKSPSFLIIPLLQGFYWFDEGLQSYLRARGWSEITRAQSMIIANVVMGVVRPSDIARTLGVSRQAIHITLKELVDAGILDLTDDPDDGRVKIVRFTKDGERRRQDARKAVAKLTAELARRIGKDNVKSLKEAFAHDWGAPVRDPKDL